MTDKARLALLLKAEAQLKKTEKGWKEDGGTGPYWQSAMAMLNELASDLSPDPPPALGPVTAGGPSLLKMSLTHNTDGLPLYPAVDIFGSVNAKIICPEAGQVTRHSGNNNGGYSVYVTGKSGLKYYFQHLVDAGRAPVGAIVKGALIGRIGNPALFPAERVPHCHLGVNAEAVIGKGKQLKYGKNGNGPDYTLGAPPIGVQI